ncbi:MAG: mammalian cell entry protein [Frankiales bacterium]|jgi:phospholipid/cholesterol/gamma-HCH transport system substrate-binding protein|nr:mammalian cell entry protein [Frankiales bacterium]
MSTRQRLMALTVLLGLSGLTAGCGVFSNPTTKHFSADFDRAVGVYVHSDVRVLGVKIGEVTKIKPVGTRVRLEMSYDASYKIPKDAQAVLLAPSIVSDRYVQLTPVYESGETLPDNVHLGTDRTAQPVELDEIYKNLDTLNQALGPEGANKHGALSDLLKVGAANLNGNGAALNSTLTGLSQAVKTLADSRTDLFGTISNLQDFTTTIARNDSVVRAFNADLAAVAAQLNGERTDLATAIKQLSVALAEVASFVKQNKDNLTANITDLASVTKVLVKQKAALREFLDTAPTALSNLQLAYNSKSGTLDTRDNSTGQGGPAGALCNLLRIPGLPLTLPPALCSGGIPLPKAPTAARSSVPRDLTLGGILVASS